MTILRLLWGIARVLAFALALAGALRGEPLLAAAYLIHFLEAIILVWFACRGWGGPR